MLQTFNQKQRASLELLAAHAAGTVSETTPKAITPAIEKLAREVASTTPEWVAVRADQYGLYGWCSDGVLEKIRHDGGSIRFGWTIWEWHNILATAEFHAVWMDPTGSLHDITPKPQGETRILFVPDQNYPADFDFDNRPRNRRIRLHEMCDPLPAIRKQIQEMRPSQLGYETRRAAKAGKNLEQWLLDKEKPDVLAMLIDQFIETCDKHDVKLGQLMSSSGYFVPDSELSVLTKRHAKLLARIYEEIRR